MSHFSNLNVATRDFNELNRARYEFAYVCASVLSMTLQFDFYRLAHVLIIVSITFPVGLEIRELLVYNQNMVIRGNKQ
jgi:hypothetical protein